MVAVTKKIAVYSLTSPQALILAVLICSASGPAWLPAVGLYSLSRRFGYEAESDNDSMMPKLPKLPVENVSARPRFVAEQHDLTVKFFVQSVDLSSLTESLCSSHLTRLPLEDLKVKSS